MPSSSNFLLVPKVLFTCDACIPIFLCRTQASPPLTVCLCKTQTSPVFFDYVTTHVALISQSLILPLYHCSNLHLHSTMKNNFLSSGSSSNSEIVRYKRDIPPAHYSFKIESLSLLLNTKVEKIESGIFEAGGYKWRMVLYPSGNTKSNGQHYISLYLANEETKVLPQRWEVNAELKLFVFDQKEDNYLTVQGVCIYILINACAARFVHNLNCHNVSPLHHIHDHELHLNFDMRNYGFLCDDSCVFGPEVFVIKPKGNYECLSMVKEPAHSTLTLKLEKFSTIDETAHFSKAFTVGGRKWKIKVYPKGFGKEKGDWFSVYLVLSDSDALPPKGKVYAEYKLRVLDQRRDQHVEKSVKHWYTALEISRGYHNMIRLGDLHEKSKGFVMNDTLIVEAQIVVISVTMFLD
ncbi:uncharacterized protein LOC111313664 [Durio zibethinus]|uniref:Uncharacterized protein LOC111313664 n=1 Tax=Durio zibethinus TaxID=66656 RepID=A0A6P6AYV5_DURZI|nr:uncharacterized protein LOC111313664 [Durio zibethinus]